MNFNKIIFSICLCVIILCGCKKQQYEVRIPDINGLAYEYVMEAEEAFGKEDYNGAMAAYLKAEEVCNSPDYTDENEVSYLYYAMGTCYIKLTEYHKAKEYFDKSLAISEKMDNEELNFENYKYLAKIHRAIVDRNPDLALNYAEKAENLALSLYGEKSQQVAGCYSEQGRIYFDMGNSDKAYDYLIMAIKTYKENSEESASVYMDLAKVYQQQELYDEEKECLEKAASIFESSNSLNGMVEVYNCLGNFYCENNDFETSILFFDKCLEILKKTGAENYTLAECHYNKGYTYYVAEDYEASKKEMMDAYQICKGLPMQSELTEAMESKIKGNMKIYYDYIYEGDKVTGFESWFEQLVSSEPLS